MKKIETAHFGAALIGAPIGALIVGFLPNSFVLQWGLGAIVGLIGLFLLFIYEETKESGGKNEQ